MKRMLALALAVSAAQPAYAESIQQMRQERKEQPFSAIDQIRFEKEKQMTEAWVNFQKTIAKHSETAPARQPGHSAGEQRLTILPGTIIPSPHPGVLPPPVNSDSKELKLEVAKFLGLDPGVISGIRVVVLPQKPGGPIIRSSHTQELLEVQLKDDGGLFVGQVVHSYGRRAEEDPIGDLYQVDWLVRTVHNIGIGTIQGIAAFLKVEENQIESIEYNGIQLLSMEAPSFVMIRLKKGPEFEVSLEGVPVQEIKQLNPSFRVDPFGWPIRQILSVRDTRIESGTLNDIARKLNVTMRDIFSVRGDIDGVSNGFFVEVKLRDGRQFVGEIGMVGLSSNPRPGEITLPAFRQGLLWMAESGVGIGTLREIAYRLGIRLSQLDGALIRIDRIRVNLADLFFSRAWSVFIRMADGATGRLYLRAPYGNKDELGYDIYYMPHQIWGHIPKPEEPIL